MKKPLIVSILITLGLGGLIALLLLMPNNGTTSNTDNVSGQKVTTPEKTVPPAAVASPGRYETYSEAFVAEQGFTTTILFFHAPWCPECRAFEQAIINSDLPDGLQILKVDYDSSTELKAKYAVTLQSTFVSVDSEGNELSKWVGYGKDKSVDAIVKNL
jgi:thiol-disulfide isomerase/thioredoxin